MLLPLFDPEQVSGCDLHYQQTWASTSGALRAHCIAKGGAGQPVGTEGGSVYPSRAPQTWEAESL